MNNCFRKNRYSVFLILFSLIYLLWIGGKCSAWLPVHFELFLFVVSICAALWLFGAKNEHQRLLNRTVICLSAVLLAYLIWFPKNAGRWLPGNFGSLVIIALLLMTAYSLYRNAKSKEIRLFHYIILAYAGLVIFEGAMHYIALKTTLEPSSYITVRRHSVEFGLRSLSICLNSYLQFPLLFLLTIHLFTSDYSVYKKMYLVPIIFVPSAIVAIYQNLVDFEFLNASYFANLKRVSGLGGDSNSFALSIYLLFPLTVLGAALVRRWWKRVLLLCLALLLMWCLALSGSRTAVLGLTVFLVALPWVWAWADDRLSKRARRFLAGFPLVIATCIIAVGAVSFEMKFTAASTLGKRLLSTYDDFEKGGVGRVLEKSQRSHLWLQAYRLIVESPMAGWGPGGFKRNLDNTRFKYGEDPKFRFIDNGNNYYLQLGSELGLFGALFNVFLILFPMWMVFRIRKRIKTREERWAVGISFLTICIAMLLFMTGPHIMAFDVLWVFVLYLGILVASGVRHGYSFNVFEKRWTAIAFVVLIGVFVVRTYDHSFGESGYAALQQKVWWPLKYEKNCYAMEDSGNGKFRWCSKDAVLRIPVEKTVPEQLALKVFLRHPDIRTRPVILKYGGKGGVTNQLVISEMSRQTIQIPMTEEYLYEFRPPGRPAEKYIVVSIDVSRTWSPRDFGVNNDPRELGVAVMVPDL